MRLNLISGIASHENVRIGYETLRASLGAAALKICDLLDAHIELRLPRIFWDIHIFAVENFVNGIGAANIWCQCMTMKVGDVIACGTLGCGVANTKKKQPPKKRLWLKFKTYLQAVPSLT